MMLNMQNNNKNIKFRLDCCDGRFETIIGKRYKYRAKNLYIEFIYI